MREMRRCEIDFLFLKAITIYLAQPLPLPLIFTLNLTVSLTLSLTLTLTSALAWILDAYTKLNDVIPKELKRENRRKWKTPGVRTPCPCPCPCAFSPALALALFSRISCFSDAVWSLFLTPCIGRCRHYAALARRNPILRMVGPSPAFVCIYMSCIYFVYIYIYIYMSCK